MNVGVFDCHIGLDWNQVTVAIFFYCILCISTYEFSYFDILVLWNTLSFTSTLLQTLQNHYHPDVIKLTKKIEHGDIPDMEMDLSEKLDTTPGDVSDNSLM